MSKEKLILKLSTFAISIVLASCGGDGYYGQNTSNTNSNITVPAELATVTIIIRDVTGFAIPAATVKIGTLEVITNEKGIAIFKLEIGKTHSAKVTANGYQEHDASVIVNAGLTTTTQTIRVTPLLAENSSVTARVFNGATGSILANTQIQIGTETMTTSANGDVILSNITTTGKTLFNVSSSGFAQQVLTLDLIAGQPSNVNLQLLPLQLAGSFNPAMGGTVSLDNSADQVDVTANSLIRIDGQPIVGNVSVNIAPINSILDIHQLPGELVTVDSDGQRQPIESFGATTIYAVDATKASVSLKTGSVANVRIPVITRSTVLPATTPLYIYMMV